MIFGFQAVYIVSIYWHLQESRPAFLSAFAHWNNYFHCYIVYVLVHSTAHSNNFVRCLPQVPVFQRLTSKASNDDCLLIAWDNVNSVVSKQYPLLLLKHKTLDRLAGTDHQHRLTRCPCLFFNLDLSLGQIEILQWLWPVDIPCYNLIVHPQPGGRGHAVHARRCGR
jgi:hypothetical protein